VYDSRDEQRRLAALLFPRYLRDLQAVHHLVASAIPELTPDAFPVPWRLDDPSVRALLALAAEQVVLIDGATQDALRAVLAEGQRRGYSTFQVAHGVPGEGFGGIDGLYLDTWKGRSETIARTELATASVAASLDRYAATGMVERVRLHEHADTDEPCAARNGKVVPLASKPGLLHPNCRLGIEPIVEAAA
jgi:hypothetical protein